MKKTLFLAIMAGVALAGCVKNEEVAKGSDGSPDRIAFDAPVVGVPVRATEIADNYPTDADFGVFALYHIGYYDAGSFDASTSVTYMNNVQCTYNGPKTDNPTDYWAPVDAYYWPKTENSKLSFGAYAPSTASGKWPADATVAWDGQGFTFTNFEVDDTPANQIDLLYSDRALDKVKGGEVTDNPGTYDGIQLVFRHALSSIVFTAQAQTANTVILTGIKVDNIYSKGTFTQGITFQSSDRPNTTGTDTPNPQWSNYDVVASYDVVSVETALTTEAQTFNSQASATNGKRLSDLIVLPQNLRATERTAANGYTVGTDGAKDATVTVSYKIKRGSDWIDQKTVYKLATGSQTDTKFVWERNKRYTYAITIGLDAIYFSPKVENFDEGTTVLK